MLCTKLLFEVGGKIKFINKVLVKNFDVQWSGTNSNNVSVSIITTCAGVSGVTIVINSVIIHVL